MIIDGSALSQMERRFRANLVNSLGGFKSLVLVGTISSKGNENLAPFSSLFHLGANPALCGLIFRPGEPRENTLGNILHTQQYTINHVLPSFYDKAHQCSAKYQEGLSEFKEVNLTSQYIYDCIAPFVVESKIKFACELVQTIHIELNGTILLIGKIVKVVLPDHIIQPDGFIDLEQAETVTCSGLDSYHVTQKLARLSYANLTNPPVEI